ncbi:MAG TPA: NAD-dependent epimerase/dehydratase family protein [Gaiellaceae bacterium]|nr:NAD-dependent epimerase/dehydratase family protein [Gaiellaceae bacterium]
MRTLVTGGAGFIGSYLVRRLAALGDEVVVLDALEPQVHGGVPPELPEGVRLLHGDVGDAELADRALAGVDRVVHLAAAVGVGQSMYEIARYVRANSAATAVFLERLVAVSPRPASLVVASSMSIYGEGEYLCAEHGGVAPRPRPAAQLAARDWECRCPACGAALEPRGTREEKPLAPTSVYAVTKRDHEELCLAVGGAYGIRTTALRFFNVYGPGQALSNPYTGVAAIFSSRLLNGRRPIVFEDGRQTRDLVHVSDVVEGILLALGSERAAGHAVNLGTGRRTSVLEVAGALAAGLGVDVEPEVTARFRAGDIRHCYADTRRAEELLGFRARVPLERGMAELVAWLAGREAEDRAEAAAAELTAWGLTL